MHYLADATVLYFVKMLKACHCFTVGLDASFASQTACLLASPSSSTSEEVRATWQRAPLTKEAAKGITAWPWTATAVNMKPEQLQQAKLAAIRVQLALLAYHLIEGDRSLPFVKGMHLYLNALCEMLRFMPESLL